VNVSELLKEKEDFLLAAVLGGPVKRGLAILLIMHQAANRYSK
jgi:hypothetical protein